MARCAVLVITGLLLGAVACAGEIDLLEEAQRCRERMADGFQAGPNGPAGSAPLNDEERRWITRAERFVAESADSPNAGDHVFRSWMLEREPLMAARALAIAVSLAPDDEFVLRQAAESCLRRHQAGCADLTDALLNLPEPSADALILAAALGHGSGKGDAEDLYRQALSRPWANSFGDQVRLAAAVHRQVMAGRPQGESDQVVDILGLAMAAPLSPVGSELAMACLADRPGRRFTVEPSTCLALTRKLATESATLVSRSIGAHLWVELAGALGIEEDQARTVQAEIRALTEKSLGVSCFDDFEPDPRATLAYLDQIVHEGEYAAWSRLVADLESAGE